MRYYHIVASIALATLAAAAPAKACSVVDDYRVPTNLELADQSSSIVLARVIGEIEGGRSWQRKLLIQPIETIKGDVSSETIEIEGSGLVPADDERGFGLLSNPYELEEAHPLSYIGGCIRNMFPKGTTVLFFIGDEEGAWRPAGGPFSRWAEDVLSADAPWLQLTRIYAAAAALPEGERTAMLEREMVRLSGRADDPVAQLMVRDIARQLAGPNETWNAIMHRMIGMGPENEAAAEAIAELVMETAADEAADEAEAAMAEVEQAESMEEPE